VWSRQLVLVFGNTTEAIGTIVAAFMAGLGGGGLAGGLLSTRLRRPLVVYGLVELTVGAYALLMPFAFQLIANAYGTIYETSTPWQVISLRLLLVLAAVTPITFLMGLTLPLLTRHFVHSLRNAGARIGALYGANTIGAMAGTVLAGVFLIELMGLSGSADIAVCLNLLAGAVALTLSGARRELGEGDSRSQPAHASAPGEPAQVPAPLLYLATAVSGFAALALEVMWTRMLAEGTGSLIYNFVAILAVFLLGIALGGWAYRASSSASRDNPQTLALAFLGTGLFSFLTVPVTAWLSSTSLSAALVLLPATFCMGYAFPLSARLLTRQHSQGGRSIGVLYAWNTVGSIAGSLGATFVLAGWLGTNASILVLAAANAAVAPLLLLAHPRRALLTMRIPVALVAAVVVVAPPVLVLGAVSPWAIRLRVGSVAGAGDAAGRVYALSTAGGLVGTFASALALIPLVGTRWTFLACAALLALAALPGAFMRTAA
jgi:spermidine synthase